MDVQTRMRVKSKLQPTLPQRRALLLVLDILLINGSAFAALWLGARRSSWPFSTSFVLSRFYWFLGISLLYIVLASVNDCYDPRVASNTLNSFFALLKVLAEMLLLYQMVYFFAPPVTLPRHIIIFFMALSFPLLFLWRALYVLVFSMPALRRKAIIVGAGWAGRTIAQILKDALQTDYQVVGYIDDDPRKQGQYIGDIPVIGNRHALGAQVEQTGASEIILAITSGVDGELFRTIMDCHEQGIQVTPMSLLYEQMTGRLPVEHVGDNWSIILPLGGTSTVSLFQAFKRLVDIILSLMGLLFLALLLPFIALAVYLDCPGPIFYLQERVGKAGLAFRLIKIRSMICDAEEDGQPRWVDVDDCRITRVGRLLRRTRLDELPQLLNILRGQMSFIGPRPERPEFVAQLQEQIPFYRTRLAVRPGLTGWAQINYSYGSSVEDALVKLQYDLYYIKHQSLYLDLLILLKTIGVVLALRGR